MFLSNFILSVKFFHEYKIKLTVYYRILFHSYGYGYFKKYRVNSCNTLISNLSVKMHHFWKRLLGIHPCIWITTYRVFHIVCVGCPVDEVKSALNVPGVRHHIDADEQRHIACSLLHGRLTNNCRYFIAIQTSSWWTGHTRWYLWRATVVTKCTSLIICI